MHKTKLRSLHSCALYIRSILSSLEKETQKHIRLENLLRMLSESSFIESSISDLEYGFSTVESGFL